MVTDDQTTLVYVTEQLPRRFPAVARTLARALGNRLRTIRGAKDIWCRDFMPVQTASGRFVQFRYTPDYLRLDQRVRTENGAGLLNLPGCLSSDLIVDGGNVVRWHDAAIMTDKIYRENSRVDRPGLRRNLKQLLEVDRLIIIPTEPGDVTGHADGVVRFVDGRTVLLNDYRNVSTSYGRKVQQQLRRFGIATIPFAYRPSTVSGPDPQIWAATGYYINYLQVRHMILVPQFGLRTDTDAARQLQRVFPQSRIVGVPSRHLAKHGGVLNCIAWNVAT